MRYRTFMLLRNLGGAGLATLAVVGAFLGCRAKAKEDVPPPPTPVSVAPVAKAGTTTQPVQAATAAPTAATASLSANDKEILRLQKQPLSNGSDSGGARKWVARGESFKAEFRADTDKGAKVWNRVKIDYDNDKKWDERWDFKDDGSIKRRVAPGDDENYRVEYKLPSLTATTWVRAK